MPNSNDEKLGVALAMYKGRSIWEIRGVEHAMGYPLNVYEEPERCRLYYILYKPYYYVLDMVEYKDN